VGTATMDRRRWGSLVDGFLVDLAAAGADRDGPLDVRENVRFQGGDMAASLHGRFGDRACVLSLEFKKTFMDEWTGEIDPERLAHLVDALAATLPAARARLEIS